MQGDAVRCRQGRNMNLGRKESCDGQRAAVLRQGAGSNEQRWGANGVGRGGGYIGKSRGKDMQATIEMLEAGRKQLRADTWDSQLAELRQ